MSTQSNGHGGNGSGIKPPSEVVSAESDAGSPVAGRIAPLPGLEDRSLLVPDVIQLGCEIDWRAHWAWKLNGQGIRRGSG